MNVRKDVTLQTAILPIGEREGEEDIERKRKRETERKT